MYPLRDPAMRLWTFLVGCVAIPASSTVYAHGGGLNRDGCHHNHKTGDYHCHNGGGTAAPRQPFVPRLVPATPRHDVTPGDDSRSAGAFRNCSAARAAGAAPVHRGEPGYGPHLDRDGDGIGCESYRGR